MNKLTLKDSTMGVSLHNRSSYRELTTFTTRTFTVISQLNRSNMNYFNNLQTGSVNKQC